MANESSIVFPSPSALLRRDRKRPGTEPFSVGSAAGQRERTTKIVKAKPPSAKTKTTTYPVGAGVKPKQSKSRNGCVTCKQKRLKCDETKPTCQQCFRRKVECGGYKKDFKWRPFEEAAFANKFAPVHKAKREEEPLAPAQPSSVSASNSSPAASNGSSSATSPRVLAEPPEDVKKQAYQEISSPQQTGGWRNSTHFVDLPSAFDGIRSTSQPRWSRDAYEMSLAVADGEIWKIGNCEDISDTEYVEIPPPVSETDDAICDLLDLDGFGTSTADTIAEFEIASDHDIAPKLVQRVPTSQIALRSGFSPEPFCRLVPQPKLSSSSMEMVLLQFRQDTCGILSIRNGPTENPWRTTILPLAQESKALYHALASMTAFHGSKVQPHMKVSGIKHMDKSVSSLRIGLQRMRPDLALASTLVLAFAESWDVLGDVHVSTGIKHLHGARACINKALPLVRQYGLDHPFSRRIKFLCNTWVYMDVIARLTSIEADEGADFNSVSHILASLNDNDMEIDPLMGCARSLFPLVGRVANLVRQVRKSECDCNSPNVVSLARKLKAAIQAWQRPLLLDPPEDKLCDVQHSIHTAEAYRWATLLYLHQAVPAMSSLPAAKLARRVLCHIEKIPPSSRTTIVHIYPLLAAGCESVTPEERDWVERRWRGMSEHMRIGNVDRCLEVVKEVWTRRDRHDAGIARLGRSDIRSPYGSVSSDSSEDWFAAVPSTNSRSPSHDLKGLEQLSLSTIDGFENSGSPTWLLDTNASRFDSGYDGTSFQSSFSPLTSHRPKSLDFEGLWLDLPSPQAYRERYEPRLSGVRTNVSSSAPIFNTQWSQSEILIPQRTVRGRQHWIGVMEDWGWEVLLG